jgi:hypothetical protein
MGQLLSQQFPNQIPLQQQYFNQYAQSNLFQPSTASVPINISNQTNFNFYTVEQLFQGIMNQESILQRMV